MFAAALILATVPGGSGADLRDPVKTAEVVRIEWNNCITEKGELAYAQIIWWDLTQHGVRCVGYRMVRPDTADKYRWSERQVRWKDRGVEYRVSGLVHGTVTLVADDPEICDRKRLPSSERPELFR